VLKTPPLSTVGFKLNEWFEATQYMQDKLPLKQVLVVGVHKCCKCLQTGFIGEPRLLVEDGLNITSCRIATEHTACKLN
jgi:hypothetical protein